MADSLDLREVPEGDFREHVRTRCDWLIPPTCRAPPNSLSLPSYELPNKGEPCLGVGACLKVNTRALGRGALQKVDSIPLSLTSEHTGFCNKPTRFSSPVPFISHPRACLLHALQTPNSRKSLYLPNISNSPPNRYDIMITNTCWSGNVRKNKTKSKLIILFCFSFKSHKPSQFPSSCQEISAICIFQIKNNQPLRKISHPKLRVLLDPPNVTLTRQH